MRRTFLFAATVLFVTATALAQNDFTISTTVEGNAYYPGEKAVLRTTIARTGSEAVKAFRVLITLPFGWTYEGDENGAEVVTEVSGLTVDHVWILPPVFPLTMKWTVKSPATAVGPAAFALSIRYRLDDSAELRQEASVTAIQSTTPPGLAELRQRLLLNFDAADTDSDGAITPAEALAFDEAYDAEIFDALDANSDGVVDELELSVNVLAGLDCGCTTQDGTGAKRHLGDLLLLSMLMGSLTAMGVFAGRK